MSYLKPNTAGVYDIPSANIDTLYIKGKKFQQYIDDLSTEDQLEQSEITEIKLLLEYLDTTGLNIPWTVANNNVNETLRTAITALQTKLANIDTTALSQTSVLTNDNRNSVLKTAIDTANSDIDTLENKTRFITEASVTGTGDFTTSTYTTKVGPPSNIKGISVIELNQKNAPANELIGYRITSNFNDNAYGFNESLYSHRDGRLSLQAQTIRIQPATGHQLRLGNFAEYNEGASNAAINIGGRGQKINIGSIDTENVSGDLTEIVIGKRNTTSRNTNTSLNGNIYLSGARFEDMGKSAPITLSSILAFMSPAAPSYLISFLFGGASLARSDVWTMKGTITKDGDVETSNALKLDELYVLNTSVLSVTPKIGFWMAKADYSCTQLIGSHRTQVFEGDITIRNNNVSASSVDWAFTEANDKVNVVNIGGNNGMLIHQGASDVGAPLRIINSRTGAIRLDIGRQGTKGTSLPALLVKPYGNEDSGDHQTQIGTYFGQVGTSSYGSAQLEVTQFPNRDGLVVAKNTIINNEFVLTQTKINHDSIITGGSVTANSVGVSTATTGSLVISGNYTGDTTARLYKNADNKLYWNGAEVGAGGGGGSAGIQYYIPLANNVTNPAPSPATQTATELYTSSIQRTISQSTTAVATGLLMAKYQTEIINKSGNPIISGVQTLQQYLVWNQNNTTAQIYGQLWFQAATSSGVDSILYQRTYAGGVETNGYQVLNGTPIPAPAGLFNIAFRAVLFPNILIDTFNGATVTLRCRLEGQISGTWTVLQTSAEEKSFSVDLQTLTVGFVNENFVYNQTTTTNAPTAYRVSLYATSSAANGQIKQLSSGSGNGDLCAYSLGAGSGEASIRVLLYNGESTKLTVAHSALPIIVPLELPIVTPYTINTFTNSRLGFDIYFYQPTGAVNANYVMTFYFNDGSISHIETTIKEPPAPTPTLAQVTTAGNTASQSIDMNSNAITGITALEGASGGNWLVKQITAGTDISVSANAGNYTIGNTAAVRNVTAGTNIGVSVANNTAQITNTAPVQDATAGTNISVSKANNIATIANTAPVQDATAGTNISVSKANNIATIANTAPVQDATAGTNISVSKANNIATITNTAPVQNVLAGTGISVTYDTLLKTATISSTISEQQSRDEDQALVEVGALPAKPEWWGTNWAIADTNVQSHFDLYVSVDGRVIASAGNASGGAGNTMRYSTNYGVSWANGDASNVEWRTVCGNSQGSLLLAFGRDDRTNATQLLYKSTNGGQTWTNIPLSSAVFGSGATLSLVTRVRCSGDGVYVTACDGYNSVNGRFYTSANSGATWTQRSLVSPKLGQTEGLAMSRSGAIQYISWRGLDSSDSAIYRSFDYGTTFTQIIGHVVDGGGWRRIECDATGRFVYAARYVNVATATSLVYRSEDYGATWATIPITGTEDIWVSGTGQFVVAVSNPQASNIRYVAYSTNYGQTYTGVNMGTTTTFRSLGGSADGTILVMGSVAFTDNGFAGDGKIRIARQGDYSVQDLDFEVGGVITNTNGFYTMATDVALWETGTIDSNTQASKINFSFSRGSIDLMNYNIKYEIEFNWNLETSESSPSHPGCFMSMGFQSSTQAPNSRAANTMWMRRSISVSDAAGSPGYLDQYYANTFLCGWNAGQWIGSAYRYRTILTGEISRATTRPAQFSEDFAPNSRMIMNRFTADLSLYDNEISSTQLEFYVPTLEGQGQQQIIGTAIWEMANNNLWNGISSGIDNIYILLHQAATGANPVSRRGYFRYRIYRIRK